MQLSLPSSMYAMALAGALLLQQAHAATWYFLDFKTEKGEGITEFHMDMVIPTLPAETAKKGTYYLWPGLEDVEQSGVYQNVLDGRKGSWWIGTGWCCANPKLPWGKGFDVKKGDVVNIKNEFDGKGWINHLTRNGVAATSVTNSFNISKVFTQAIFAAELTNEAWDFGSLSFKNVVLTAKTSATKWCTKTPINWQDKTHYNITGLNVKKNTDGTTTCTVAEVVMINPLKR